MGSRRSSSRRSSSASAAARLATTPRRERKSSTISAPSTCARASRSSTPRPTACFRSPRTRTSSPSTSSTGSTSIAFDLVVGGYGLGRVIARPFVGEPGRFTRTANRRDFAMAPTSETVLDRLTAAHVPVVAIGKIDDLFAGRGITRAIHTKSDDEGVDAVSSEMASTLARTDLREPRRLRHAVRASQRRRRVCRESRAVRRAAQGSAAAAAPRRSDGDYRGSWQRSDHAEHRPLARARAAACDRAGGEGRRQTSGRARRLPTSARRLRTTSGWVR